MIRQKVDSGMSNSASEVVRDAPLRLMDEKDSLRAAKLNRKMPAPKSIS